MSVPFHAGVNSTINLMKRDMDEQSDMLHCVIKSYIRLYEKHTPGATEEMAMAQLEKDVQRVRSK